MGMKIKTSEGGRVIGGAFKFRFSASAAELSIDKGDAVFPSGLIFEGTAENAGGFLRVTGKISGTRRFICDRCLSESEAEESYFFSEDFPVEGESEREIDLSPFVRETALAALPIRNLCGPDCKGLCPKCGENLNKRECGCDREVADFRLSALKGLLASERK